MKPRTVVDICNLALSKIGEPSIKELDGNGGKREKACWKHYDACRRAVLQARGWGFAAASADLNGSEEGGGKALVAHTLPADCVRVGRCSSGEYRLTGRTLYSREAVVRLHYVRDVTEVRAMSALFVDALATLLAVKLSEALQGASKERAALQARYNDLVRVR